MTRRRILPAAVLAIVAATLAAGIRPVYGWGDGTICYGGQTYTFPDEPSYYQFLTSHPGATEGTCQTTTTTTTTTSPTTSLPATSTSTSTIPSTDPSTTGPSVTSSPTTSVPTPSPTSAPPATTLPTLPATL